MLQAAPFTRSVSSVATLPRRGPRRDRRWSHRAPCFIRIVEADGELVVGMIGAMELKGETVNMSPSGLAIHVAEPIPTGVRVEAVIARWSGCEELRLLGRVVHTRRMLAGLFEIGVQLAMPER
jgi:hypothetical protein